MSFPIKHGDFPWLWDRLPEGTVVRYILHKPKGEIRVLRTNLAIPVLGYHLVKIWAREAGDAVG